MLGQFWLNQVEKELYRNKLPRQEVARLIAELSDHLADCYESHSAVGTSSLREAAGDDIFTPLKEYEMSMDASLFESLGSPTEVAETAAREFRREADGDHVARHEV